MTEYSPLTNRPYDPNKLLDVLLDTFGLENDEALSRVLHVGAPLIRRIRCGQAPVDALLLIRMNELSGISVRELRRLMGDRRAECRAADVGVAGAETGSTPVRRKKPGAGDAGLPSSVQWT